MIILARMQDNWNVPELKKDKVLCFMFGPKKRIVSELKFTKEHEWIRIEKEGKE